MTQYVEMVPMSAGPSANNKPAALNSPTHSPDHAEVRVRPADALSAVLLCACSLEVYELGMHGEMMYT